MRPIFVFKDVIHCFVFPCVISSRTVDHQQVVLFDILYPSVWKKYSPEISLAASVYNKLSIVSRWKKAGV